jgi:hypothetical protein
MRLFGVTHLEELNPTHVDVLSDRPAAHKL